MNRFTAAWNLNHSLGSRKRANAVPKPSTQAVLRPLVPMTSSDPSSHDVRDILNSVSSINILDTTLEHNRNVARRFEELIQRLSRAHAPQLTVLPSLAQYNFIRALQENIKVMGLSQEQLNDEALSPFNVGTGAFTAHLPPGLQSTQLQITTAHHPWIDLLPIPEMRDNLFRKGFDYFDEEELCHALRGRIPGQDPGMLVWRDPWDPDGWEVTETFARSWGWAISGCWGLLRSTNEWRTKRGERPLFRLPPAISNTAPSHDIEQR